MFEFLPSELSIAGVYVSPVLVAGVVGLVATWLIAKLLNRARLSRYFWHPPFVFLAIWAMVTVLGCVVLGWS